ncbi:MAG: hypothetical protein CM15mP93_01400 [Thiotrichaceae bacterium]|nr:MAG: hypothetical protein CM15mP93_01400 [Thiotrichaceae bacterium]
MSIKNDNWIKQMSIEHDMINPFVDDQTKKNLGINQLFHLELQVMAMT